MGKRDLLLSLSSVNTEFKKYIKGNNANKPKDDFLIFTLKLLYVKLSDPPLDMHRDRIDTIMGNLLKLKDTKDFAYAMWFPEVSYKENYTYKMWLSEDQWTVTKKKTYRCFTGGKNIWVPDSEVSTCMMPGCNNRTRRWLKEQHHCRECGYIICKNCCKKVSRLDCSPDSTWARRDKNTYYQLCPLCEGFEKFKKSSPKEQAKMLIMQSIRSPCGNILPYLNKKLRHLVSMTKKDNCLQLYVNKVKTQITNEEQTEDTKKALTTVLELLYQKLLSSLPSKINKEISSCEEKGHYRQIQILLNQEKISNFRTQIGTKPENNSAKWHILSENNELILYSEMETYYRAETLGYGSYAYVCKYTSINDIKKNIVVKTYFNVTKWIKHSKKMNSPQIELSNLKKILNQPPYNQLKADTSNVQIIQHANKVNIIIPFFCDQTLAKFKRDNIDNIDSQKTTDQQQLVKMKEQYFNAMFEALDLALQIYDETYVLHLDIKDNNIAYNLLNELKIITPALIDWGGAWSDDYQSPDNMRIASKASSFAGQQVNPIDYYAKETLTRYINLLLQHAQTKELKDSINSFHHYTGKDQLMQFQFKSVKTVKSVFKQLHDFYHKTL